MSYDFVSLSHRQFEDLTRDLIGRELGIRFEAFGPGPDGGMDGRYVSEDGITVLQAKHSQDLESLNRSLATERRKIDRLGASRYLFATSISLNPKRKQQLLEKIGPSLTALADLYGRDDLNALIRRYPDIERSHLSLLVGSTVALQEALKEVLENFYSNGHDHPHFRSSANDRPVDVDDAMVPGEYYRNAAIAEILDWGGGPDDNIQHVEDGDHEGSLAGARLRFIRPVSTMHPDEIVFVRVLWFLCRTRQIEWKHFDSCARTVAISSDAEFRLMRGSVSRNPQAIHEWATKLIRSITSFDRGAHYAGWKEAVLTMAQKVEEEPLRAYLAHEARILTA